MHSKESHEILSDLAFLVYQRDKEFGACMGLESGVTGDGFLIRRPIKIQDACRLEMVSTSPILVHYSRKFDWDTALSRRYPVYDVVTDSSFHRFDRVLSLRQAGYFY